jgi:hypothetical protein
MHRATQKIHRATKKLGRVRAVARLCGYHPGICLATEEKARKNLIQSQSQENRYRNGGMGPRILKQGNR